MNCLLRSFIYAMLLSVTPFFLRCGPGTSSEVTFSIEGSLVMPEDPTLGKQPMRTTAARAGTGVTVVLRLRDHVYNDDYTAGKRKFVPKTSVTDNNGQFRFDSVYQNYYSIEAYTTDSSYSVRNDSIDVGWQSSADDVVILLPPDTLKQSSIVRGVFAGSGSVMPEYVVVVGSDTRSIIDTDGVYMLNHLPEGVLHLQFLAGSAGGTTVELFTIRIEPGKKYFVDSLYGLTYLGNDSARGSVPIDANRYRSGDKVIVRGNGGSLTRANHSFVGWNDSLHGNGKRYLPGDTLIFGNIDITLYAQWIVAAGTRTVQARNRSFSMGQTATEPPGITTVTFRYDYRIDTAEITQREYRTTMSAYSNFIPPAWSDLYGAGDEYPVYYVNWYEAALFCNARTRALGSDDTAYLYTSMVGTPGKGDLQLAKVTFNIATPGYRLPTEAEWEYACRAGTLTRFYNGSNEFNPAFMDSIAWYRGNSTVQTHPVAQKKPNAYGLYDMYGNVWEWCSDWYVENYPQLPVTDFFRFDDSEAEKKGHMVLRGGGYDNASDYSGSTIRGFGFPKDGATSDRGFRCVLPAVNDE